MAGEVLSGVQVSEREAPRRHWALVVLGVGAGLVLGLGGLACGGAWAYGAHHRGREQAALEALEQLGLGLSPASLRPEPARNGAEALARAFTVLEAIDEEDRDVLGDASAIHGRGDITLTLRYPDLDRAQQAELLDLVLEQAAPALEHVDEALSADRIQFELDWEQGLSGSMEWLLPLKRVAQLLVAEAYRAQAAGDPDRAWRQLERALALCQRVQDPILMARLVRHVMLAIAVAGVEGLLQVGPPPDPETAARLDAALRELEVLPPFHAVLRTELALGLNSLEGPQGLEAALGQPGSDSPFRWVPGFVLQAWLARERASYVERLGQTIQAIQVPPEQVQARLAAVPPSDPSDGILVALLEPALAHAQVKDVTALANLRLARTLLTLAAQRSLPATLPQALADPWASGSMLRYRRESSDRAVIWSVGVDQVDDLGVPLGDGRDTWDQVLTFERPR